MIERSYGTSKYSAVTEYVIAGVTVTPDTVPTISVDAGGVISMPKVTASLCRKSIPNISASSVTTGSLYVAAIG
jgi:hypothetical protein